MWAMSPIRGGVLRQYLGRLPEKKRPGSPAIGAGVSIGTKARPCRNSARPIGRAKRMNVARPVQWTSSAQGIVPRAGT
jgi:hypothetical protein